MDEQEQRLQNIEEQLANTNKKLDDFLNIYYLLNLPDRVIFEQDVFITGNFTISDGIMKIGTASTQKLSFFGAAPVVQQAAITPPSGGGTVDAQCRTATASLITLMQVLGFTA